MEIGKTISNYRLNAPTIWATIIAVTASAWAANEAGFFTKSLGYIADLINIGISDLAHCIAYNLAFTIIFGYMNREHYSKYGKFSYSGLFADITFKLAPVGCIVSVFIFHVPRNFLMYWLIMKNTELWMASVIADITTTAIYIPTRNYVLKYYELFYNFIFSRI